MTTRRRSIIEAIDARLSKITKLNGYATDVGESIYLGENVTLTMDDPIALAIKVPEDTPSPSQGLGGGQSAAIETSLSVGVLAVVSLDSKVPLLVIEDLIGDIKTAMELNDRTLGGLVGGLRRGPVRGLEREEGSSIVGAEVQYQMVYSEDWGTPAA